jgi:5-methylcytosine-specific restriction endonuclease McrA
MRTRERQLAHSKARREGVLREALLAQKREYYRLNKVRILAAQKKHYEDNKESHKEYGKRYREQHSDVVKLRKKEYCERNKEAVAEKKHRDYLANRESILRRRKANPSIKDYMRRYQKENKLQMAKRAKEYRAENAERLRQIRRERQPLNRAKKRFRQNRRNARKVGNGGSHTYTQWLELCARLGGRCAYCGEEKELSEDHKTPISRGGTDDIDNIAPACRSCNFSKGTRTPEEFLMWRQAMRGSSANLEGACSQPA